MTKRATIKSRSKLFGFIERVRKGEALCLNDAAMLAAAREFHDEGLIVLHETTGAAGAVLHIERNF